MPRSASVRDDDDGGPGPPTKTAYAEEVGGALERIVTDMRVPGAVVLIRSASKGDWWATYGRRRVEGGEAVTMDDHFRVGSNTKTMTGTVILQLVQEGAIGLDDPVSKHRPGVPNGDSITIAMLLEMRSGLYSYSADKAFNARLDDEPGHVWHPPDLLTIALAKPRSFDPGEGFEYSNTNTVLLGLIIEQLTKGSLATAFRQRIFDPLELHHTSLPAADDARLPPPHPQGYMFGTNVSTNNDPALTAAEQAATEGTLSLRDVTADNPSWGWAAGSVISTAGDLARYVEALVDGGLLAPDLQERRLASISPVSSTPDSAGYGLALAKFGPMVGHDGQIPGYSSFMACDPDERNTVIVLTSLSAGADGQQPANEMAKAIIAVLYR